jgi:hypothetical protein
MRFSDIKALSEMTWESAIEDFEAWFKNTRFRVTLGLAARTLSGPVLKRVYASPG